ncbi:MAG: LuxR family transcriptional regulator [Puniceicoccaceae bacterium]|nr:MAG: LuxR family transcriptional regulator [Puniceicoccaceae bacterium]
MSDRPPQRPAVAEAALELARLCPGEIPLALLLEAGASGEAVNTLLTSGDLRPGDSPGCVRLAQPDGPAGDPPWPRRRELHHALAEAATRLRLTPAIAASHYEAALDLPRARAAWSRAAQAACASGDFHAAHTAVDRALANWPWTEDPAGRVALLREKARCARQTSNTSAARTAWKELAEYAADTADTALEVEALHQMAGLANDPARVQELLVAAADLAERALPPREAFRHLLTHVDHLANRVRIQSAETSLARALRLAETLGDPALRSEALGWQALLAAMSGRHQEATRLADESLRLALSHRLPEQTALAYRRQANVEEYRGRYGDEIAAHNRALGYCKTSRTGDRNACLACLSYACFRAGRWRQALSSARAVANDAASPPMLKAMADCIRGLIAAFRGERGPALRLLEPALHTFRADDAVGMQFFAHWGLGFVHHLGDRTTALGHGDAIRSLWRETEDLHDAAPGLLFAGALYADAGLRDRLDDCLDILLVMAEKNDLDETRGALAALRAEQLRLDHRPAEAAASLDLASTRYAAAGLPVEQVWCECRRGPLGLPPPSPGVATALSLATRLGMRPLLARLRHGAQRPSATSVDELTPRQHEMVTLLASGLTSKEIADRLGLSPRTVEMHVSRLLQRLNCRTRSEAVRLASEQGWLAGHD